MAESINDDDEDLDSLEEKSTSSSGDDDMAFLNETPSGSIGTENKLPEKADRAQAQKPIPEKTAVGKDEDKKAGALDGENLMDAVKSVLGESIKKELSGMSESVKQTVQNVVKEVTPEIVRNIIQEEIEKIKKFEDK